MELLRYWPKVLFFGAITIYYIVGVAPDMTWMSQAGDSFDYVIGSKYFWAVRPTGYPTYIMIGWLFERLPFNDFFNLGLLSTLSSVGACIFVYKIVRYFTLHPWAPYIGVLTYAGSFLIWSQSVVPEVYTLTILLMLAATYFALQGRWYVSAIILAVSVGTHHLIVFTIFPLLVYLWIKERDIKLLLKCCGIGCVGFLAYLQTALFVGAQETTSGLLSVGGQSSGSLGFVLALPLWETWNRTLEAIPMVLTGLGTGLLLLLLVRWRREAILIGIMALLPFCYYFFSNIPMWIVYAAPAFAFAAVLAGWGSTRLNKIQVAPFMVVPVVMMGANLYFFDIGNTIDPVPTGARQLYEELDTIPDGSILYIHRWGEPWLETYYYSVENDDRFAFVFEGELRYHPDKYVPYKEGFGVKFPDDFSKYGDLSRNGLYYSTWDSDKFLEDFVLLNEGKEVYVVSSREGKTFEDLTFVFGLYSRSTTDPLGLSRSGNYNER